MVRGTITVFGSFIAMTIATIIIVAAISVSSPTELPTAKVATLIQNIND